MGVARGSAASLRAPGRPRSAEAHQAILDATLDLLADQGFEAMSMEGVAARAGVGKTTIYRRWSTKEALVIEAVRGLHAEYGVLDTGSLRGDLLILMRVSDDPRAWSLIQRLLPRFIGEIVANPGLVEAYQDAILLPRFRRFKAVFERAIARGELRPDLDPMLAVDLFAGAFTYRLLITRYLTPMPPDYIEQILDTVLRGIAAER